MGKWCRDLRIAPVALVIPGCNLELRPKLGGDAIYKQCPGQPLLGVGHQKKTR